MLIGAKSCRSCEHRLLKGSSVFCRRYPPQTFVTIQSSPNGPVTTPMSWYPPVNPDEPCGEYKRNDMNAREELGQAQAGIGVQ
jgi:hypothetical protein